MCNRSKEPTILTKAVTELSLLKFAFCFFEKHCCQHNNESTMRACVGPDHAVAIGKQIKELLL